MRGAAVSETFGVPVSYGFCMVPSLIVVRWQSLTTSETLGAPSRSILRPIITARVGSSQGAKHSLAANHPRETLADRQLSRELALNLQELWRFTRLLKTGDRTMRNPFWSKTIVASFAVTAGLPLLGFLAPARAQQAAPAPPADAITAAQTPAPVQPTRPEQQKTAQDQSDKFSAAQAVPSSPAFGNQPEKGQILGFDFYRDPLNAKKPMESFEENMKADIAAKAGVMETQRRYLAQRFNLTPVFDPQAKMSRGKPLCVGPTALLPQGVTWESLAASSPEEIRRAGTFPYTSLPHPKQTPGGQVFPQMQIAMFPRLERFDVDFDLPDAFLPEFPPAIFLQSRTELGDVSRGEVVSINNYYRLFKDILTPVQLDGLRLLLTPSPRKSSIPPTTVRAPIPASV